MDFSPRKSADETCGTIMIDLDSPITLYDGMKDGYYEKYIALQKKYSKLHKEYTLLAKSIELKSDASENCDKIQELNEIISEQRIEILELRKKVDSLNEKTEKARSKRRNFSLSLNDESHETSKKVLSLEISADVCLIKFLIHRLFLGQSFRRDELLRYRMALNRIEEKFSRLSETKKPEIMKLIFK